MTRVTNIESLTAAVFSEILREKWPRQDVNNVGLQINEISTRKVDEGVLSDVYRVHLDYMIPDQEMKRKGDEREREKESTSVVPMPPSDWLVKFCRPDLDLSWMIRNETIFYRRLAPSVTSSLSLSLPFTVPKFLSGSDKHLILQEVKNIETYPLSGGCPPEKIDFLLRSLAAWHAGCWESELLLSHQTTESAIAEESLVCPPGMGQGLPPLQKEGLFVASWQDTIDYMRLQDDQQCEKRLDDELLDFITGLCRRLATLKLRDIHEKVHRHRLTCVHGDYHIANWLFPMTTTTTTTTTGEERKPVLVDFATSGYGNPLVDFVFFIVVSTNDDVISDSRLFLQRYYRLLIEYDPNLSSKITLSTLHEWFPWALLCQFMILVAYDGICRDIAAAEQDEQKRESQIQHFCNVNRRMILAIRSVDNWDSILSELEPTTVEERQEAQAFCRDTALVI